MGKLPEEFHDRRKKLTEAMDNFEVQMTKAEDQLRLNGLRRLLYSQEELLRMDAEELLAQVQDKEESPDSSGGSITEFIASLDEFRDKLALATQPNPSALPARVFAIVRSAVFLFYMFSAAFFVNLLLPLQLLHPVFRMVGVQNNWLPMDLVQRFFANSMLLLAGVHVTVEGKEHLRKEGSSGGRGDMITTLGLYSHASNLDAFVMISGSPIVFKWLAKTSIYLIPIFGWTLRGFGNLPISRSNLKAAIRSFARIARVAHEEGRSIAIAPEGTRSKTGQLLEFKKGPFHLQRDVKLAVSPALIFGAHELWSPRDPLPKSGQVTLRFLPSWTPDGAKTMNENRLAARRLLLKALTQEVPPNAGQPLESSQFLLHVIALCGAPLLFCMMYQAFVFLGNALHLSEWSSLQLLFLSVLVVAVVDVWIFLDAAGKLPC